MTDPSCHRDIHRRSLVGQPINLADPAQPSFGPKRAYSPPQLCWQISGWSAGNWYTNIWRDAAAPRKRGGLEFNCGRGVPPSSQSRKALRPQGPGVQPRRGLLFVRLFERDGNLPGTVCPALLPIRHNPPERHKGILPREPQLPVRRLGSRQHIRKSPAAGQYAAGDYLDEHLGWASAQRRLVQIRDSRHTYSKYLQSSRSHLSRSSLIRARSR